jgi:hypothetical protein
MRARLLCLLIASAIASACRHVAPPILRFAPPGTDHTRLQRDFALTDTERLTTRDIPA